MRSAQVDGVKVVRSGPLASLQDAGRFGSRELGLTQGGACDLHAWAWSNWLVGNRWGCSTIEVTYGGLTLEVQHELLLALTGADLRASLDGQTLQPWQSFMVQVGQRISFRSPQSGMRSYLAVAGGWQADTVLGSTSCVSRESIGGHDGSGKQLAEGDILRVDISACTLSSTHRNFPEKEMQLYCEDKICLDFVLGAQAGEFSGRSLFDFFNEDWEVTARSDRMGICLSGPKLKCALSGMVSEGLTLGAVQVPPDGQPIVLMNDRQTIGGYPRLGTLTPLSCSRLAQCVPGQKVRFKPVPLSKAHKDYIEFLTQF